MLTVRIEGPLSEEGMKAMIAWAEKQPVEVALIVNTHFEGRTVDGKWKGIVTPSAATVPDAAPEPVIEPVSPVEFFDKRPGGKK